MGRHHRPARYGAAAVLLVAAGLLLGLLSSHADTPWADGSTPAVAVDAAPVVVHPPTPPSVEPVHVAPAASTPQVKPPAVHAVKHAAAKPVRHGKHHAKKRHHHGHEKHRHGKRHGHDHKRHHHCD